MEKSTKKITKAQKNEDIMAMLKGEPVIYGTTLDEALAHLAHENELLAKKNSGDVKKPTKAQTENEVLKASVLKFLASGVGAVSATEVMHGCGLASNQKAAALLRSLKAEGKVDKVEEKGRPLFFIVEGE